MLKLQHSQLELSRRSAFATLFLTDLFERFSNFGLRALMVLYFVQEWHWSDPEAYGVFGAYIALISVMPVIGGALCDRVWGHRVTTIAGGSFILVGHLCLTFLPSQAFLFGLAFVIVGTGLMVPSLCSLVGALYPNDKLRHDRAYNLFYMSVNVGGILAGFLVGLTAHHYGWHAGFGLAAIGMVIGLIVFCLGWSTIAQSIPARAKPLFQPDQLINIVVFLGLMSCVGLVTVILHHPIFVAWLVGAIALLVIAIFARLLARSNSTIKSNIGLLIFLNILSLYFFIMYEQSGTSINLFTERVIDRHLFNFVIPTPVLSSINPIFIILFAPVMAFFWKALARCCLMPTETTQVACGLILTASGLLTLAFAAHFPHPALSWLIAAVLQMTIGELCIGPILLAAISKYAPPNAKSTLMGVWFMMTAIASYLAAFIARLASVTPMDSSPNVAYAQVFSMVGCFGLMLGVLILLVVFAKEQERGQI